MHSPPRCVKWLALGLCCSTGLSCTPEPIAPPLPTPTGLRLPASQRLRGWRSRRILKGLHSVLAVPAGLSSLELLIVLLTVGLLVSVAIPEYQQARNAALVSSRVDQLKALAKACVVINATGIGRRPAARSFSAVSGGVLIRQGCTRADQGATLVASWGAARAAGIQCYSGRSTIHSSAALLTISQDDSITCQFKD